MCWSINQAIDWLTNSWTDYNESINSLTMSIANQLTE